MQPQHAFGCFPSKAQKWEKHKPRSPPAALSGPCVLWLEWKSGERHRQEGYEGRQGEEGSERGKECHQHFGCRRRQKREREGERVPRRVERWLSTTKSLAVLTDQTVLCIRAAWHFFSFFLKKCKYRFRMLQQKMFPFPPGLVTQQQQQQLQQRFQKLSSAVPCAHESSAQHEWEESCSQTPASQRGERETEREGGRESVTGVRHLAAQMRYSGCPGALLHGVCRWQHWTLVFLISFCTGWTAVIKGYPFFLKIYIYFLRDPHAHFDWLLCSSWPHAEQHCSVFISHCPMWCIHACAPLCGRFGMYSWVHAL